MVNNKRFTLLQFIKKMNTVSTMNFTTDRQAGKHHHIPRLSKPPTPTPPPTPTHTLTVSGNDVQCLLFNRLAICRYSPVWECADQRSKPLSSENAGWEPLPLCHWVKDSLLTSRFNSRRTTIRTTSMNSRRWKKVGEGAEGRGVMFCFSVCTRVS